MHCGGRGCRRHCPLCQPAPSSVRSRFCMSVLSPCMGTLFFSSSFPTSSSPPSFATLDGWLDPLCLLRRRPTRPCLHGRLRQRLTRTDVWISCAMSTGCGFKGLQRALTTVEGQSALAEDTIFGRGFRLPSPLTPWPPPLSLPKLVAFKFGIFLKSVFLFCFMVWTNSFFRWFLRS